MSDGLDNENTRNKLKELALDDLETNETDLMKTDISFRLYVSETDYPLVSYAKKLCDRLKQAGFFVDLKEYSNTMMLSRVVSGKYDVFLASDDFIDVITLTQMDYMIMDSEEMRWAGIYEKMEYDFVCFNASHFYDSWNHGQLYAERSWK